MISLLLLDLDGVIVFELAPPYVIEMEIILLHQLIDDVLREIEVPVVILTHRSRAEAKVILQSAGIQDVVAGIIAAEDIFKAACLSQPWRLFRDGLRKSWALATVERRYGINRQNIAFIDDRQDNITDMMSNSVGLAILAPSGIIADGSGIESFDIGQMIQTLKEWSGSPSFVSLRPRHFSIEDWSRTGIHTGYSARHIFNHTRHYIGRMRRNFLKFLPHRASGRLTSENTHE
jgi:hypothetical protein